MKGVLGLAADFLDQLSNPAQGVEDNESHTARFHDLISRDPELRATLLGAELHAGDVDLLSTPAWLWYLAWRRSQGASVPAEEFIQALFDSTGDLVVRLKIVEAAATDPVLARSSEGERERARVPLEAAPASWLRTRLLGIVRAAGREEAGGEIAYVQAEEMAVLLLQVGNDTAYTYLRALLAEPWRFQAQLREFVRGVVIAGAGEDEETVARWRRDLGL
jgi:hypothetical protein